MMNTFHTSELNRDLCMAKLTPIQLPQQEISDEEIMEAAGKWVFETNGGKWSNNNNDAGDNYGSFMEGCKWYREQLKNKKNKNG
jgi:hypothetical protein